jgi:Mg-chelatase subunit ChlD
VCEKVACEDTKLRYSVSKQNTYQVTQSHLIRKKREKNKNMENQPPNNGLIIQNQTEETLQRLSLAMKLVEKITGKYQAEIKRGQPTAFVFLIDQSGSMANGNLQYKGIAHTKAGLVTRILNKTLEELVNKCTKLHGIGEYFDIAIIGYGQDSEKANLLWEGNLQGKTWVTPSDLQENVQKQAYKVVKNVRNIQTEVELYEHSWFSAVAKNQTPMYAAFCEAENILKTWISKNPYSYPPTIINITDGAATDANDEKLIAKANELKNLATNDGNVLLFNVFVEASAKEATYFPADISQLPDDKHAKLLFEMSSLMPKNYHQEIATLFNLSTTQPFKAMVHNAGADALVNVMNVGTRTNQKI